MRIWHQLEQNRQNFHGGVVTIGNFDGLHLGHQSLLAKVQQAGSPRVVLTFDPHPSQVLFPERRLQRLFPREDLVEQLPNYAVDLLVILPFDREFAKLSAEQFLLQYVGEAFSPKHIVAGYDFAIGRDREGTLNVLRDWATAQSIQVSVLPPLQVGGEVVSSRRVRELILRGEVRAAGALLGRPYYLRGGVIRGAGRGATIGIPTLNQLVVNETIPRLGVYASRTLLGGQSYPSVTNIGTNPTFVDRSDVKVETHVIEQKVVVNSQMLNVQLIERLRDEMKFSGVEALRKQIHSDIVRAKAILGSGV